MEYAHRAFFLSPEYANKNEESEARYVYDEQQSNTYNHSNHTNNPSQQQQQANKVQSINAMARTLTLVRGLSKCKANEEILDELRAQIQKSLVKSLTQPPALSMCALNSSLGQYSFMLPDMAKIEEFEFKELLQNELIESPTQSTLTGSGHLNWWCQTEWEDVCRPLYPMVTSGDGNCLLHAASLSMWGLHDRALVLRRALYESMQMLRNDNSCAIWRRWKWEQMCDNYQYELVYSENEWQREWNSLIELSSDKPRAAPADSSSNSSNSQSCNFFFFFIYLRYQKRQFYSKIESS
jgi:hypothetical protein